MASVLGDCASFQGKSHHSTQGKRQETLLTSSRDEAFTEYGLIAESLEWPEDRSWVIFTLRPEARWHDGKPITPEDVIFSLDPLKEKGHPQYRFYYRDIIAVEKLDERRVKMTFAEGENRELPLIAGQIPILPKHYWEGRDFTETTLEPPLGSGPYRIKKLWRQAGSNPELDQFLDGLPLEETKTYVKRILLFEDSYAKLYAAGG